MIRGQECKYINRQSPTRFMIDKGFVPGMNVPGYFYVNPHLEGLMFDELKQATKKGIFCACSYFALFRARSLMQSKKSLLFLSVHALYLNIL